MQKLSKFLFYSSLLAMLILPTKVFATDAPTIAGIKLPTSKFDSVGDLIGAIITWLLWFAGAIAVFAIIYSGIMYMTAGGDTTKAETARKNLIWAITGIIIVILSLAIVSWVKGIFVPR